MAPSLMPVDATNQFQDLSGVQIKPGENPYNALIDACHDHPVSSFCQYGILRMREDLNCEEGKEI
jgi:hypothetical protein